VNPKKSLTAQILKKLLPRRLVLRRRGITVYRLLATAEDAKSRLVEFYEKQWLKRMIGLNAPLITTMSILWVIEKRSPKGDIRFIFLRDGEDKILRHLAETSRIIDYPQVKAAVYDEKLYWYGTAQFEAVREAFNHGLEPSIAALVSQGGS
jgi:hypothetical protein